MDMMLGGDLRRAEKIMQFLFKRQPKVPEIYNNLAVVLSREERWRDALVVLEDGMARFPRYEPLYTNGIRAAHGAGDDALEQRFEKIGLDLADNDPYFLFARGVKLYQDKNF